MKPQVVGQILKILGLQTKAAKVAGKTERCIVYDEAKLNTLKKRYIPCDDEEETTVTSVTTVTGVTDNDPIDDGDTEEENYPENSKKLLDEIFGEEEARPEQDE